jgi:hypothetical protein
MSFTGKNKEKTIEKLKIVKPIIFKKIGLYK